MSPDRPGEPPYDAAVRTEPDTEPAGYTMLWAVRAVPVLMIFGALDLLKDNPPTSFLVLTLVRLGTGLLVLVAIHKQRRDRLALAYVFVVFITSLVHPVRGGELLVLAALALVVTAGDLLLQRSRRGSAEPDPAQPEPDHRP
ncbi:MAG: hypothetical protein JWR85_483 [Marmoricola sp.]|nr:hypothetical protein [Marmoricola sp.]